MLIELVVRDLGVIHELSLVLGPGMTAVTGETGAGKTLIVGAIDLLTGGRADASLVRPGAQEAEIEGRFVHDDEEVVVRRVIPRDGRSRVYLNGRLATVGALSEHGADLVDLHGQHAHQSLLKGPVQRAALDRFGGIDTASLAALIDDLRVVDAGLAELGGDERVRAREIDLLQHQLDEIEAAGLTGPDEDAQLDREEDLLADASAHLEAAATTTNLLDADGNAAGAVAEALAAIEGRGPFVDVEQRLRSILAELADLASATRDRAESINDDPERLAALRERRALLRELRRKYGSDLAEVAEFARESAERLAELRSHDERAEELDRRRAELIEELRVEQARVRAARVAAAPRLGVAVESHLRELAMAGARLDIAVEGPAGDEVVFRLAANAGHDPLPLAKVASGGELARTMLALRLVLTAGPPTLVFDEVDAGIGGEAANTIGASLARLAETHQVLVVSHLAQVAAVADHHVAIFKHEVGGSTMSAATLLDRESRIVEVSRMLSGSPDSEVAREHAVELLDATRS
jgi:DNA repair protein RecN (Recombination protein N)